jgi:hypothetical protein
MDLVEVDVVDAEAAQAGLARGDQVGRVAHVGHPRHDAALGGQHDAVAQAGPVRQGGSEVLLARAPSAAAPVEAVDVGIVDQGHPGVDRRFQQVRTRTRVGVGEAPAPESDRPALERPDPPRRAVDQPPPDLGAVGHPLHLVVTRRGSPRRRPHRPNPTPPPHHRL